MMPVGRANASKVTAEMAKETVKSRWGAFLKKGFFRRGGPAAV
jgi:hypothetical protein